MRGFLDDIVHLNVDAAEMCMGESCSLKARSAAAKSNVVVEHEFGVAPKGEPAGKECTHEERYRPAYELLDGSLERAGRVAGGGGGVLPAVS